ncbi:LOW QUALITY PROTEIN: hypothetical protein HID58_012120, partial [Brassica napus]
MDRSMPESGGPLARRQRQGRPSVTTAEQHDSVGGIGLKGATAARHAEPEPRRMFCCTFPLLPLATSVEVVADPLAVQWL